MRHLLNTRDIAQMYQVTSATVLNWIRAGKLKAYATPGGHYRVAREDLEAFSHTYSLPPVAGVASPGLRLLLVGADADFFGRLRNAIYYRWPAAQVELARTEFEIGWWLARLAPTHLIVHPSLTPDEMLDRCKRFAGGDAARDLRLITLPDSPDDGLSEWIDRIGPAGV